MTQYSHDDLTIEEHRFIDPVGGKVYVAYSNNYGEYDAVKISSGAVLIDRAQGSRTSKRPRGRAPRP